MRETALEFLDVIFQQGIFRGFDLGENNGITRGVTTRNSTDGQGNSSGARIWLSGNNDQGIKDSSWPGLMIVMLIYYCT